MKFIGINGGTFDPIHYGHLRPALEVQQRLGLEQVLFVPCYQPVHRNQPHVSAKQRCEMVELAIANQPSFKLETYEIDQGGPSYMVQTLAALKLRMPDDSLVLMMGTDAFVKFHKWNDWQGILKLANIVVMHRPGEPVPMNCSSGKIYQTHRVTQLDKVSGQIVEAAVTQLDISSTLIREHIQRGDAVDYLLPSSVMAVIEKQGLYQ
ncbi:MAG: nicotinate-nucleotide adenylyltransferase [Thiomicrorhabdus sp.]|nr:MAG: nicotinate-nucleotide adenylyltransferase [Thiomicrorhabdus sp.]